LLAPAPLTPLSSLQLPVHRQALYIGEGDDALFGWFHTADGVPVRDCVAVVCPPLGHEYVHSHRSVRYLADTLARAGVPALRFDYHGTGDSPGSDLDPGRVARWLADVRRAIDEARARSGRARVCLVGIRLGATLAALASAERAVDQLVLWGPAVSGRRYVREMQAIAQASELAGRGGDTGWVEPAGFVLSAETQEQLKALSLLKVSPQVRDAVLLVSRDDVPDEEGLQAHLASLGREVDTLDGAGFAGMMAEPHHTVVPQDTLDGIAGWLVARSSVGEPMAVTLPAREELRFDFPAQGGHPVRLVETPARFGEHGTLFGIHTRPDGAATKRPTVVLFSSGATHRIGPSRLYTTLARNLAAHGYPTLRCDIEGIGDSVAREPGGLEAHPYPPTAVRDASAVLRHVGERHGPGELVLAGLCSGAYTAFQAALDQPGRPIAEVLLINPLIFSYDGGELPDVQSFRIAESSKGAMRKMESWKKLLRGQIRVRYLLGMGLRHVGNVAASHGRTLAERVTMRAATLLSRQLDQLFQQRRHIAMFLASGEAGWNILHAGARRTAGKGVRSGHLKLLRIDDADHTFSSEPSRAQLVGRILEHLNARFRG